jgi:hypothetical protein
MYQQWGRQVSNNRSHVTLLRKKKEKKRNFTPITKKKKKKKRDSGNWVFLFNVKRMSDDRN